ncbi:MAG: flagellar motor switch protein FliN [Leptospiraceae bacterium]|nr:flagellar motor switch protein FliN [Leptospiraceae bacterium]
MGEGSLSQEEIDALLQGADETTYDSVGGTTDVDASVELMPQPDRNAIAEIIGLSFSMAGNTLSTILSKNVKFTNPSSDSVTTADLTKELGNDSVCIFSDLSGSINGRVCLIMSSDNASKIINILMAGLSKGGMDMGQLQTLKDSFSPILGTVSAQLGIKLGGGITGSPVEISMAKSPSDLILPDGKNLVQTSINLNIEGVATFKVFYVMSQNTASEILSLHKKVGQNPVIDSSGGMSIPSSSSSAISQAPAQNVGIKGVAFPSFANAAPPLGGGNLNLLMDVQMSLTVELGRTKMYIKDILGLGEGSIIELDKLAGEPVDLLVNGKLIAKGEVVVIDENFGVRVTDIVSPTDRIKSDAK